MIKLTTKLLNIRHVQKVLVTSVVKFQYRNMASISATPPNTLVDEKVAIKVSGLDQGSKVTVRSYLTERGLHFEAHGHYVVDRDGVVAVDQQPAVSGTYTDVEPMGLFWSMIQSPGQRPGMRFTNKDVTKPMKVSLSAHNGHLDISALQNDSPIVTTQIQRTYLGPNVECLQVHSGRLRGTVFKPKGSGPFKGVIDMFGSSGGHAEFRAALLASRGFVAYALPYFRYADLPDSLAELDLDYFEEATDWLQQQSYVQPGGIGLCAVSWGAEVAALMASTFPEKISACVSISGSCTRTTSPMTYKGKFLPFLEGDLFRTQTIKEKGVQIVNIFDALDPLETAPAEAIIELEKAQRLLFLVGLDDKNWNAPLYIDAAERRLRALGCNNYEVIRYPKAGHLIEPPYAPITLTSYYSLVDGVIEWGGSMRDHERAQEDAWPRILKFLDKYIGNQPTASPTIASKL